jgi:heme/copper-type cytochrome/quinol oxidase subunit 2
MPSSTRPRRARTALPALAIVVLVAACGSDSPTTAGTTTTVADATSTTVAEATTTTTADANVIGITVEGGKVSGGVQRTKVRLGEQVTLRVDADVADEVHLHGYDKKIDVAPGYPAELVFTADIPGVFEVELESAGLKLAELEVS